jgi:RNA recognition motif-containing protein
MDRGLLLPWRRPSVASLSKEFLRLVPFDSTKLFKHKTSRELTAMKLYVGNLPFSVTEAELRETFSRYGDVAKVDLVSDRFTGESRGFGFVEMDNNSAADAAIKSLNGSDLRGRNMTVNQAKPKTDRSAWGRRV